MNFKPRAVANKQNQQSKNNTASTSPSSSISLASSLTDTQTTTATTNAHPQPTASTSKLQLGAESDSESNKQLSDAQKVKKEKQLAAATAKAEAQEASRLQEILSTVETSLSDYGLSMFKSSGLLEKLKQSHDGYIHLQQILNLPPVAALAKTQFDLQKALRSHPSSLVELSESGFQLRRTTPPDYDLLASLTPEDWDARYLYLENIPQVEVPGKPHTSSTLVPFLSTLLNTPVTRVILPPLFDPLNPSLHEDRDEAEADSQDPTGQSFAFAQSQLKDKDKGKRKPYRGLKLPTGGGSFKGFAFVVVLGDRRAVDRILDKWVWEREEEDEMEEEESVEDDDEGDDDEGEGSGDDDGEGGQGVKKVGKKSKKEDKFDHVKAARRSGFRALAYSKFLDLKREYFSYRRQIESIHESRAQQTKNYSINKRDNYHSRRSVSPPAQASQSQNGTASKRWSQADGQEEEPLRAKIVEKWGHEGFQRQSARPTPSARHNNNSNNTNNNKRPYQHTRLQESKPPSPHAVELTGDDAVNFPGAFPTGCVLWIRNLWLKSTRSSLRNMFEGLLEELEEGYRKGVEFIDYEKGLDTCHLRFSSSHLASRLNDHLNSTPLAHTAPAILTPFAEVDPSLANSASDPIHPLTSQVLAGSRERLYWENLPEATRREARKFAAGPATVAEVGKKRRKLGHAGDNPELKKKLIEEVVVKPTAVVAEGEPPSSDGPEQTERKRKRASKFS
ncbi:hypothetical protein T439DRAFT_324915 [Meredithblackwellia eburnea MCA 4105]